MTHRRAYPISRTLAATAVAAACLMLGACQKAADVVSQKAIEKAIESEIAKNGAKDAKVDLSTGAVKTATVDKDGKTETFEMGNAAAVTEADVGLPFYPGAAVDRQYVSKMATSDEMSAVVPLKTTDPTDKVAAFYRERLKAMSAGWQLIDMAQGDGDYMMMLSNEAGEALQVVVSAGKDGAPSSVMLTTHRKKRV